MREVVPNLSATAQDTCRGRIDMCEEDYEEVVLAADTVTVTVRRGYGRDSAWLGIAKGNHPFDAPDIIIELTPRQQRVVREALGDMWGPTDERMAELRDTTEGIVCPHCDGCGYATMEVGLYRVTTVAPGSVVITYPDGSSERFNQKRGDTWERVG